MPIVVRPDKHSPLTQGDILRGVPFAIADVNGNLAVDQTASYLLVLSRPCKALRDDVIVVAPIYSYRGIAEILQTQEISLDKMRRLLAAQRDGIRGADFSDLLYLGALDDGSAKRFAAQLTTLSSAMVPQEPDLRERWIQDHRVWRLQVDFARDLHSRLLLTFTRLGFDDHDWFSDVDLDLLITAGEKDIAVAKTELSDAEQAIQRKEAGNENVSAKQRSGVDPKKTAVADAEERLRPYLDEREKRRQSK